MADETTEPVQPDEGQGGDGTSDAPYAEYLSRIPEEARGEAEQAFKAWDADTTRKFQEASEYRKGWEPFESLGVNQREPAEVEWALQMLEAAKTNPAEVWRWAQEYAQTHNLTKAETEQLAEEAFVDPSVTQLVDQQLAARLGPLDHQLQEQQTRWQTQEQQATESRIQSDIRSELDSLKEKHKGEFDESLVDKFIANHMSETDARVAVQKAFADAQTFRAQIEKQVLQSKVDDSGPGAESGGAPATDDGLPKTMKEANKMVAAQLRERNRLNAGG